MIVESPIWVQQDWIGAHRRSEKKTERLHSNSFWATIFVVLSLMELEEWNFVGWSFEDDDDDDDGANVPSNEDQTGWGATGMSVSDKAYMM